MLVAAVPVTGAIVGLVLWLAWNKGLRPGIAWRAGLPSSGLVGSCLAFVPAAYVAAEPRMQLVVGVLAGSLFALAWGLVARDPAAQPKIRMTWRNHHGRLVTETLADDDPLVTKIFSSRRSLTGGGIAAAAVLVAGTTAAVLRARPEADLGMAGLWLGGGLAATAFGAVVAYLLGGLVGGLLGLVLPPEAPLQTYDPHPDTDPHPDPHDQLEDEGFAEAIEDFEKLLQRDKPPR